MRLRDIDVNLLLAFDALLRERHVTRAAERLDMSQSSMSVALARLRDVFQDELLTRSPAGWTPTCRAEALWPRVQAAIASIEEVFDAPSPFDPATAANAVRMIVIDYIDLLLMPQVMRRLRGEAPGVRIEMLQPRPKRFGEMLAAGELDLALTYFPSAPDYLKGRRLFSDRFVAVCGAGNDAARGRHDPASFCALPHVTVEPESAQIYNVLIDEALEPLGLRRNVTMVKPSFLALPFLLEKTDLVACIPARLARRMAAMASIELFDVPLDLPAFDVQMMWHPRTHRSPAHEWLRTRIVECAEQT